MRTLINAMADTRPLPWNVVLVVGAGNGAQLPLLRRLEASRLLLVEPNPEQRELLARAVNPARGEEVLDIAVTAREAGEVTLCLYNDPAFSSFAKAGGLLDILPNLKATGQVSVPCKPLHALVAELGVDHEQRNLLLLDAPGQLELLDDANGISAFSDIVVKAGSQPLYEGDPAREALQSSLAKSGFDLVGVDREAVHPFAIDAYARNDARVELARLHADLAAAQHRAKVVQGLESELAEAKERVAAEQTRIGEFERQAEALVKEKAQLAQELGARTTEGEEASKKIEALNKQLEHLKQRLNHLDEQLLNARDAMALAVRLQTLRENDLEDLRERYAELHHAHQSQRALLTKLSGRLVAANEYFQQLAGSGMLALEQAVVVESPLAAKKAPKKAPKRRANRTPGKTR